MAYYTEALQYPEALDKPKKTHGAITPEGKINKKWLEEMAGKRNNSQRDRFLKMLSRLQ